MIDPRKSAKELVECIKRVHSKMVFCVDLECAQKCNAPIVPIVLNYSPDRLHCTARIGEPFNPDGLSLADGICMLRDRMAELRWSLWEQKGIVQRNFLNPASERTAIMKAVEEYPSLDLEYEQSVIFDPHNKPTSDERA